ncbi:phosphate ABC transporter permease subunit PstC [Dictyobacter arantiisoli]|uniref:Phosphate transport system permease protein n=1 Tax=Dictyobacter arantiisoli TaxID=2014874 RepID=A0A5A5TDL7_9CHLR|nr:phosphate ABC transporter permease subunit PstC [Dictyobacter arantiisoli]GCF09276.1 putative ABC transporter permease protein YqgH [Dictyobacter arantiisoli]
MAANSVNVKTENTNTARSIGTRRGRLSDQIARGIFFVCAVLVVVIIFGVFVFLGINGLQMFKDPAARNFFTSSSWDPSADSPSYGALGFILGSVVTTLLSIIIVAPIGFGMALYMTEMAPRWVNALLRPLLEVFTGVPSVVIGFLGLVVLVPWIANIAAPIAPSAANAGNGWAAATLILVIMILPTVVSVSIDALRAVPDSVREASLALGSTRWQMMKDAVLPAAATGLGTAIVLGMTRAIGEALAVSMVLGGDIHLPAKLLTPSVLFQPNINITNAIVLYFSEASGTERNGYFMLGFVLLIISFLFICVSRYIASRSVYK